MATATEHSEIVLAAILHDRRDLLDRAVQTLSEDHFPERHHQKLFSWLVRYHDTTGGAVLPLRFLGDMLSAGKVDPGQARFYTETYQLLTEKHPTDADFAWSLNQLREQAADRATGEALTEALEILRRGKTINNETVHGHHAARAQLLESFQEIDRSLVRLESPEGLVQDESIDILDDYASRKMDRLSGKGQGIGFGVAELDAKVGGMQPGELVLAAGYSSDGKSSFCVQTAWAAAVEQGKNVAFLTTETLRPQIRRKLVARHSKLPMFDLPEGLNTRDIKAGTLSEDQERSMVSVVEDLTKNPSYGKLYIAQIPRAAGIASIEQRLHRIQRQFNIDLVVMDYLALLVSERRRQTSREEYAAVLKDAKLLAVSFDNGRGVPLMSPWQVSRSARDSAEQLGAYSSAALSETAESTNSSDIVVSLLAPSDNTQRHADVNFQILKNRDGITANNIVVEVDYATCYFRSKRLNVGGVIHTVGGRASNEASSLDQLLTF